MTDARAPIMEIDLHAYADGRLPRTRRLEVEAWLAERPEQLERVKAWIRDNEALRAKLDPIAHEPIPLRIPSRRPARRRWTAFATAAAIAVASIALGWFARGTLDAAYGPLAGAG